MNQTEDSSAQLRLSDDDYAAIVKRYEDAGDNQNADIIRRQWEAARAVALTSYGLPARIDGIDPDHLRALLAMAAANAGTREAMARLVALDTLSAILWLYRRLPRAYGRQAHIDAVVERLARETGADVADDLAQRWPAQATEYKEEN